MTHRTAARAALLITTLWTVACGQARRADDEGNPSGCISCHGGSSDSSGAPPSDLRGRTDHALVSVGAHARHIAAGVACGSCHVVPSRTNSPGHGDGVVKVTFGGQAVALGATPAWDHDGATCSNVYCHGTRFTGPSAGANPSPSWTGGAMAGAPCGSCHSAQPRGHSAFALTDCAQCHPGTVDASGKLIPRGLHLDGLLQVSLSSCTGCHGGSDNTSGAPPRDVAGHTETTVVTVGAHTAHIGAGLGCTACHEVPSPANPASHIDGGTAQISWGPVATAGGASPSWTRGVATCSGVYCHGAFQGGNHLEPLWTSVGAGQGACGTCHGRTGAEFPAAPAANHPSLATGSGPDVCNACHPGTVDAAGKPLATGQHLDGQLQLDASSKHPTGWNGALHQAAAASGVAGCLRCHAARPPARVTTVVCSGCHDGLAGNADWTTTCNTCHGSAQSAAPPPWNTPNHDPAAGGAHLGHVLAASHIAAPLGCEFCHQKPATVLSEGHLDGAIHVTGYTGTDTVWSAAGKDPGWSGATSSCATAYCHGAFAGGNAANVPVWTAVGQGQAACGTCHALPPSAPHPALPSSSLDSCSACHPDTIDGTGTLIPYASGGKHLDGHVDVTGGHLPSWTDRTSPGFHAVSAISGLDACKLCHGADLDGGFAQVSCASCHGVSWRTACTMCHGGTNDQSGAPPRTTWGHAADPIRTGAHDKHVRGGSIYPGGFDCAVCHVKPADALSAGHIDGPTATVAFSGVALPATAWSRGTPTCSVYCHGASVGGGTLKTPTWTAVGQGQAACGTCHGAPPPAPHPAVTGGNGACNTCHPDSVDTGGNIVPRTSGGKHLDGQVQFASGHGPDWMDKTKAGFHGGAIYGSLSSCQFCHGTDLDGVGGSTTVACATCHGASWKTTCTMCHGGTDNPTGAPPKATFLHRTDPVATGAHSAHVGTSGAATTTGSGLALKLGCESCHTNPTSALSVGHIDGAVAVSGYTGADPAKLATMTGPSWTRASATCATAYCHGATLPGASNPTPVWTGGPSQATCGSCHGLPPQDGPTQSGTNAHDFHVRLNHVGCGTCHMGYNKGSSGIPATVNAPLHLDGKRDVVFSDGTVFVGWDCSGCHNYMDSLP